jgi:ketosteroid isomerase-like protein
MESSSGWVDMSEPFEEFRFQLGDLLAHNDDCVVTTCRASGESRTGGPPFELVWGIVWTFREGKTVRVEGLPYRRRSPRSRRAVGVVRSSPLVVD